MVSINGSQPSSFDKDPRRQQELRMRPVADMIYRRAFGVSNDGIIRMDGEVGNRHLLDIHHGIDVRLVTSSGLILTGQEKFLSHEFASFDTVTVEYKQNQHTGENGDWHKLACQFYLVGYCSKDWKCFTSWVIVDWPMMVIATQRGHIKWIDNANKNGRAKASFKFVRIDDIPPQCIIWRGKQADSEAKIMLVKRPQIAIPTQDQVLQLVGKMPEASQLQVAHTILGNVLKAKAS